MLASARIAASVAAQWKSLNDSYCVSSQMGHYLDGLQLQFLPITNPQVLGNVDSTACSKRLGPWIFPDYGHRLRGMETVSICRKPGCSHCTVSAEASTVHSDCFEFVARRCNLDDYLDYLWVVTAWRAPWRQAPHFGLQDTEVVEPDWSVLDCLDISRSLASLPPEILGIIHRYSATSILWRFNAASKLTRRFPIALSDSLLSIRLCKVAAWKRGQPVTIEEAHQLPVIRLTIDSWGIREVERLPGYPQFKTWRTDSLVFVILDQAYLKDVIALFKFGVLRLEVPKTCHGLQTWDTPTPPEMRRCCFYPAHIRYSTQFRTIELRRISGITFFYHGEIYAIHAHTQEAPCAQITYQRLSRRRQRSVVWVYVPVSQKDYITALGARMPLRQERSFGSTCLLFRMKLGGDVPVGLGSCKQAKDLLLSKSPPTTIIYNTLELEPVSVIGAYPTGKEENTPIAPFRHPFIGDPPFPNAYFSSAPLESVNRICIFSNKHIGMCIGILLQYENGAQRSLGQCRVGIDPTEDYVKPVRICFRRQVYTRLGVSGELQATRVRVSSSGPGHHVHYEQGWTCFEMQGELEFWFSWQETRLTVILSTSDEVSKQGPQTQKIIDT
ncbi:hypothetical protein NM208_g9731 [Fusarium decemcellulare]|uniref:Uncharacterized protein n=1 Tax=Fusarium decemcellulare TaxID=57161 RepID=A0ACC1S0I7_9HYPO|nr:hypothetical protein NM208_g9731 [Fusarium decemcellulare]